MDNEWKFLKMKITQLYNEKNETDQITTYSSTLVLKTYQFVSKKKVQLKSNVWEDREINELTRRLEEEIPEKYIINICVVDLDGASIAYTHNKERKRF